MKKKSLLFYLPWLLVAALCMPLAGCGGDDDDEPEPVVKPERQKVIKTFTFDYFEQSGRYLVGYPNNTPSCRVIWGSKGVAFTVYLVQEGKIYYAGRAYSNDTILTDEERSSKSLAFDVEIPTTVNREGSIEMIAFNNVESSLSGGNIECKANLRRGGTFSLWDYSESSSMGHKIKSYSLTTIEMLKVENLTSDTITIKHKGFDAKEKWYYSKANVVLTADMKTNVQGISMDGEVISDTIKVAPGGDSTLWSYYVPTGKKMTDTSLVLEINGKEVKTAPISSDVAIELGAVYMMRVQWDGKSLNWKLNDSKKEIQNINRNRNEKACIFDNLHNNICGTSPFGM